MLHGIAAAHPLVKRLAEDLRDCPLAVQRLRG
jgi:hypothetical protein